MARQKKKITELVHPPESIFYEPITEFGVDSPWHSPSDTQAKKADPLSPDEAELVAMLYAMAPSRMARIGVSRAPLLHEQMNLYTVPTGPEFRDKHISTTESQEAILAYDRLLRMPTVDYTLRVSIARYSGYCWLCQTPHITEGQGIVVFGAGWSGYSCVSVYTKLLDKPSIVQALRLSECTGDIRSRQRQMLQKYILAMTKGQLDAVLGKQEAAKVLFSHSDEWAMANAILSRWWKSWAEIEYHLVEWFNVESADAYMAHYLPVTYNELNAL